MSAFAITGGCQCGAVRYRLKAQPTGSHFCHCRMCQRAVGGPFAALAGANRDDMEWQGKPSFFQSSSLAQRGFCAACGTPLSFDYNDGNRICVTLGSLDHPEAFPIEKHYGIEAKWSWLCLDDGLPSETTEASSEGKVNTMTNFQDQRP